MQIQINSDQSVAVDSTRAEIVTSTVQNALQRFESKLTRVEVHLSDVNGLRSGPNDHRCLIEVRPAGHNPVVASEDAATPEASAHGAAQKMQSLLTSFFARLGNRS